MFTIISLYKNAFSGLSRNSWMLAFIMFINRSGAMVIPFMSVYLKEELNFTLEQAGILMAVFGIGAMVGSFLGGYLTDKIGHFRVQFYSLVIGGSIFFVLLFMKDFYSYLITVFFLSSILQCLPPANASSVTFYAKPENVTRSFALNRMAMNLGFAIGPTIGGILAVISYDWLFIADGISCIVAGFVFYFYFRNKPGNRPDKKAENAVPIESPTKDKTYLWFVMMCSLFAVCFFQLFTTLPLYYRDEALLSEFSVGILLGMNGLIVFLFEMLIVYQLKERKNLRPIILFGIILMSIAYMLLNIDKSLFILILSMMILSFAEIFTMPFMATVTVQRSNEKNRGRYMGLYTLAYSVAFVIAPFSGTFIAANFSFATLWWLMSASSLAVGLGFYFIMNATNK
jgi:predicted MFS family arabinose efflux permease